MTVEKAEQCGGCLVQVSNRDYYNGGRVMMLYRSYREFIIDGTTNYGCVLQALSEDEEGNFTLRNEFLEITPGLIEKIPWLYPEPEYVPVPAALTMKEIYELKGKLVEYKGRPVYLRRIAKESDEYRRWHYMLYLQEYEYPNMIFEASVADIHRYDGEQPEPVEKEPPPIALRHGEEQSTEAEMQEKIRQSQEQTLAYLKAAAV